MDSMSWERQYQHSLSILMTLHIFVWQLTLGYIYSTDLGTPPLAPDAPSVDTGTPTLAGVTSPYGYPPHWDLCTPLLAPGTPFLNTGTTPPASSTPPRNITIRQIPTEL